MIRIGHTSDWEIGPAGDRIDPETGLNARMMDRYRCARFVVEEAIARGAQIILHAGDLWRGAGESLYGAKPSPTQVWLARQALAPALEAGIPVVIILGNHDSAKAPAEKHALDLLRDVAGLTVAESPILLNVWQSEHLDQSLSATVLPADESGPGPIAQTRLALQIACLPYPNRQLLLADEANRGLDPAGLNFVLREKMLDCARGLAAQRIEGVASVLLIHCAFDTAEAGKENSLAMLSSEWTLNIHDVVGLGFSIICAGHYHRRQVLHENPWVGYCGSPEACGFSEEGEEKGFFIHEIGAAQ